MQAGGFAVVPIARPESSLRDAGFDGRHRRHAVGLLGLEPQVDTNPARMSLTASNVFALQRLRQLPSEPWWR